MNNISKKSFIKVSKSDIITLPYIKINENGFLVLINCDIKNNFGASSILLRTILKCFGSNYKVIHTEDIIVSEDFSEIQCKMVTNMPFSEFEKFDTDFFLNKENEKPVTVNKYDITNIGEGTSLGWDDEHLMSFEFDVRYKHIGLSLLTPILKCFGNEYKITDMSEPSYNGKLLTILVQTNLPSKFYREISESKHKK